jgi:hypothetical protein
MPAPLELCSAALHLQMFWMINYQREDCFSTAQRIPGFLKAGTDK